jgi:hypothetical protein
MGENRYYPRTQLGCSVSYLELGAADIGWPIVQLRNAKVSTIVQAHTTQAPAICIESFTDPVEPPEILKKICE